jgi:pilus assembly protein CpaB
MKNTRALVMIVVSLVIGLFAVIMASRWIAEQTSLATSKVVVATKDVDLGTRLAPEMLTLVEWPRTSVPAGAIQDQNALLKDPQSQEPRVVKVSVFKGEPILESKLAPVGTKGGLSAVIKEGKRAITVRVNDVVGVAGFALPGNYVDILVNTDDDRSKPDGRNKTVSKIVLENILVLAVAQESGRDDTKPKVVSAVTLEVSPEQAENLDLARSVGTLSLVLRNQIDTAAVLTDGANKQQLLQRVHETEVVKPVDLAAPMVKVAATKPRVTSYKQRVAKVESSSPDRDCVEVIKEGARHVECF